MFEKEEINEKACEHCNEVMCSVCEHKTCDNTHLATFKCREWRDRRAGFYCGAEFGYNKANEWHKPSEKLPERCSLVLAYAFDDTEPSLYQFVTNDQWEWMPRRIAFLSNDQIRLWKEIVLPKEIKEK